MVLNGSGFFVKLWGKDDLFVRNDWFSFIPFEKQCESSVVLSKQLNAAYSLIFLFRSESICDYNSFYIIT